MKRRPFKPGPRATAARRYLPPHSEPPHRTIVQILVDGAWRLASYASTPERTFFLWIAGGWIEIGTDVESWRQRPPRPRAGASSDELNQQLPWWLRLPPGRRMLEHQRKRVREGKNRLEEWESCAPGSPGRRRRSGLERPRWLPWPSGSCPRCQGRCPNYE